MTLPSRLKRCRTTPSRSGLRRHSRASTTPTSTSATSKFQEARSRYFQIRFVSLAGLVSINFLIHLSSCRCHITTFRIRHSFTFSLQAQNLPLQQILPILNRLLHFLIHALVHSRIDYCNSALAGVAKVYLQKLQSVQNMAARMLPGVRRSEHVTPVLEDLHWLPVSQRVVFKTASMVWKCAHGVAPAYLSDLCVRATANSGRQHLRPTATGTLLVRRARTATGQRSFAVNGPATWNRLPPALQSPDLSESAFKPALKTHLFSTARRH